MLGVWFVYRESSAVGEVDAMLGDSESNDALETDGGDGGGGGDGVHGFGRQATSHLS